MPPPTLSPVTDKDLLTIANFSNLRFEFANLTRSSEDEEKQENHTIESLLTQETGSINGNGEKRVFFNYDNETNLKDPSIPLYNTVDELKRYIGIAYEYFEKYKKDDPVTGHIGDWEILYAADGYKLVTEFIDFLYGATDYKYSITSTFYNIIYALFDTSEEISDIVNRMNIEYIAQGNEAIRNAKEVPNGVVVLNDEEIYDRLLSFQTMLGDWMEVFAVGGGPVHIPGDILTKINAKLKEKKTDLNTERPEKTLFETRKSIIDKINLNAERERIAALRSGVITAILSGIGTKATSKITTKDITIEYKVNPNVKGKSTGIATIIVDGRTMATQSGLRKEQVKKLQLKLQSPETFKEYFEGIKKFTTPQAQLVKKTEHILNYDCTLGVTQIGVDRTYKLTEEMSETIEAASKKSFDNVSTEFLNTLLQDIGEGLDPKSLGEDWVIGKLSDKLLEILNKIGESIIEDSKKAIISTINVKMKDNERMQLFQKCIYFSDITDIVHKVYCMKSREFMNTIMSKVEALSEGTEMILKYRQLKNDFTKTVDRFAYEHEIYEGFKEYPLDYFDFRVSIFKNEKKNTLVICFGDKGPFSHMKDDLEANKFKNVFLLMEIIRHFVIEMEYIKNKDLREYNIKVTGVGVGAELANIFHLATNYPTVVFNTHYGNYSSMVRTFNLATLASLFNMEYKTDSDLIGDVFKSWQEILKDEVTWGLVGRGGMIVAQMIALKIKIISGQIFSGGAILTGVISSTLVAVMGLPVLLAFVSFLTKKIKNDRDKIYYSYFYVQLCRMGIVDCSRCMISNNEESILNCKFTYKEISYFASIPEPDDESVEEIDKILEQEMNAANDEAEKKAIEKALFLKEPPLIKKSEIKKKNVLWI